MGQKYFKRKEQIPLAVTPFPLESRHFSFTRQHLLLVLKVVAFGLGIGQKAARNTEKSKLGMKPQLKKQNFES